MRVLPAPVGAWTTTSFPSRSAATACCCQRSGTLTWLSAGSSANGEAGIDTNAKCSKLVGSTVYGDAPLDGSLPPALKIADFWRCETTKNPETTTNGHELTRIRKEKEPVLGRSLPFSFVFIRVHSWFQCLRLWRELAVNYPADSE